MLICAGTPAQRALIRRAAAARCHIARSATGRRRGTLAQANQRQSHGQHRRTRRAQARTPCQGRVRRTRSSAQRSGLQARARIRQSRRRLPRQGRLQARTVSQGRVVMHLNRESHIASSISNSRKLVNKLLSDVVLDRPKSATGSPVKAGPDVARDVPP